MRLITILLFSLLATSAYAAQELHLQDGTIIRGDLISFTNGVYTFNSPALGTIKIPEDRVISLNQSAKNTPRSSPNNQANLQQIQSEMLGDAETMQLLQSLQNDPDVIAIMNDPEIMQAIQNGDFKSLENNPQLQKIMEKSQVKAINEKYSN